MIIRKDALPSCWSEYEFSHIDIKPMGFLEILQYLENLPESPLDRFIYDYDMLLKDDSNIRGLLILDFDYVLHMKKGLTIAKDLVFDTTYNCPDCSKTNHIKVNLSELQFHKLDSYLHKDVVVNLSGKDYGISVPTMEEFMAVASKYVKYKKVADIDVIKLISLFEEFESKPNEIERSVLNANYEDISVLKLLEELYFERIKPIETYCKHCSEKVQESERRLISVGVDALTDNFLPRLIKNNPITEGKILFKQVRQDN